MSERAGRVGEFLQRVVAVFVDDVQVVKDRDPAATNTLEIVLSYPGLHALWMHRVANYMHRRGVPLLPRLLSMLARAVTGIEIHQGATIGRRFFIDHGMGVVIGETCEIGENVTIFQGVTLGGTGKERGKRHPTVEDNVVIAAGAKVLGPIKVGRDSRVGAGAVVIQDVPPNCTVVGVPGRVAVRSGERVSPIDLHHENLPDPVLDMFNGIERRLDRLEHEREGDT
ncbi:MAG: serine O-acetyltransferase [Actinobacteria bacterium]|nr:serine O-acetyltransferase [Actinomycetota bacterium]MCG2794480.1 serine O-acetyltransferase [Actinomycetes bacterium]